MGVAVNETGRDDMAFRVDELFCRGRDPPDTGDLAVLDADVGAVARSSGAVNNHAVLDDEIVCHAVPSICLDRFYVAFSILATYI